MSKVPVFDPFAALAKIRAEQRAESDEELSQKLSQPIAREIPDADQTVKPTLAGLATLARVSERAVTRARPCVKEEEGKNTLFTNTYARESASAASPATNTREGPARVARVARVSPSHCNETRTPEIGLARVFDDGLREWRAGLEGLSPERAPCPGYRLDEWARTLSRALDFLDTFGPQAEALGWTGSRQFGVHPEAGIVRVDTCGGLVLPGSGRVRAITATEIRFDRGTHREKPGQPKGVPLWRFGR